MCRNCFQSTLLSSSLIDSLARRCLYCTSDSLMQKWSSTRQNSACAILPFLDLSNAVNAWDYESTRKEKSWIAIWFVTNYLIATLPRLVQPFDPTLDSVSTEFVTSSLTICNALSGLRFSTLLSPVTEDIMDVLTEDLLLPFGPTIRSRKSWYDSLQTSSPRL